MHAHVAVQVPLNMPVAVVPDSPQECTSCGWDYPKAGLKESQCETNELSEARAREPTEQEAP